MILLRKFPLLVALVAALLLPVPCSHAFSLTRTKIPVIRATDSTALQAHIGQKVAVEGLLVSTARPSSDKLRFLNFSDRKVDGFTAALVPAVYTKFPDFDHMAGRWIRVIGILKTYKQKTVIKVSRASQVKILKAPKTSKASK